MFQNSVNNTFTENIFQGNLSPLAIVGKRTETRWSLNGRGNYWSTYDGYDLDGDKIGDIPMRVQNVFHYLEGQNANVRLYLYSPASQALAAVAKAFPSIMINEETDEYPLMQPLTVTAFPAMSAVQRGSTQRGSSVQAWFALPIVGLVALSIVYHRMARRLL